MRKLRGTVKDREPWSAAVHGVARSRARLSDCTTTAAQGHTVESTCCLSEQDCIPPPTRITHI